MYQIAGSIVSFRFRMTTFTKISEGEKPLIEVDAGKKLSKIDPMTYGGFTEYVSCLFYAFCFVVYSPWEKKTATWQNSKG